MLTFDLNLDLDLSKMIDYAPETAIFFTDVNDYNWTDCAECFVSAVDSSPHHVRQHVKQPFRTCAVCRSHCSTRNYPALLHQISSSPCVEVGLIIMGPSFVEGCPIMCWSCPSVRLSVPCLHLEGKRKGLRIPNLVGRVPGTPAPRGPISRSRGQGHGG